ncbi:hypothetical protein N7490_008474 [Penicillium lividum]|nr:hypothetical protein N7490_008474 [Penicillium lividum]
MRSPILINRLKIFNHWSKLRAGLYVFGQSLESGLLFWENLATKGILRQASHKTVYRSNRLSSLGRSFVQLFWVYFPAPVDEAQLARIDKLRVFIHLLWDFQSHLPAKIWAN